MILLLSESFFTDINKLYLVVADVLGKARNNYGLNPFSRLISFNLVPSTNENKITFPSLPPDIPLDYPEFVSSTTAIEIISPDE